MYGERSKGAPGKTEIRHKKPNGSAGSFARELRQEFARAKLRAILSNDRARISDLGWN
jgi:hypothetical protein